MPREPWNEFLNGAGPSTPRGRGRGGGRGGFSHGSGSGRGGYTPKRSFNADYTNMGLDYDQLNSKKGYGRMDGFSVDPFGSATPPAAAQGNGSGSGHGHGGSPYTPLRGRGGFRGRGRGEHTPSPFNTGRGRGRGGGIGSAAPRDTPSGSRTPVTGLGYHAVPGAGVEKGKAPMRTPVRALAPRSTVGKGLSEDGRVLWGGAGGAPLFVKAGELFKDGEVDVITHDEDKEIPLDGVSSPKAEIAHKGVPVPDDDGPGHVSQPRSHAKSTPAVQAQSSYVKAPALAIVSPNRPSEAAAAASAPRPPVAFATHDAFSFFNPAQAGATPDGDEDAEVEIYEFGRSGTVSTIRQSRPVVVSNATVLPATLTDAANGQRSAETPSLDAERDVDVSSVLVSQNAPDDERGVVADQAVAAVEIGETAAPLPVQGDSAEEADKERGQSVPPSAPGPHDEAEQEPTVGPYQVEETRSLDAGSAISPEPELTPTTAIEVDMESLVFIDTAPATSTETPALYETSIAAPVGVTQSESSSEEEEVVFKPRTYKQPKPIQVNMPPKTTIAGSSRSAALVAMAEGTLADEPSQPKINTSRKAKKAAKKEKRKMRGTGKKAARRSMVVTGSDVEWGSDGAPRADVEGGEEDSGEEDMEVLRDYLAGTILNGANGDDDDDESEDEDQEARGDAHPGLGSAKSEKLAKGRMGAKVKRAKEWDDAPEEILDSVLDASGDDSSELGDLAAVMAALDSDDDSGDDDDEDEEQLFKGGNAWSSEDENDWFVRSMEEALSFKSGPAGLGGPTGKGKGKSGLFGLGGMEEVDDFDLPTVPVKKGKKKLADVPEELQAQWEADRRKKAAKKQERELERILSQLAAAAPSGQRASKGKGRSGGKGKGSAGKGSSKAQAASLAHLIPASASAVADMFDVSSDEAMSVFGLGGRVRARRGVVSAVRGSIDDDDMDVDLGADEGLGMAGLVSQIRVFVRDAGRTTFTLPPMDKDGRRRMHMLAECFDLKSKSKGAGKGRFTILIKTSRSGMNVDENAVERLVAASEYTGGHFFKAFYTRGRGKFAPGGYGGGGGGGGGAGKKGPPGDRGQTARAKDGDLVGGGAERIGAGNIGHRLLSMMGWAEGGRIGRMEGGLEQPIVAVVKNTKSGLGA